MIKTIYSNSLIYRLITMADNAYQHSRLKAFLCRMAEYAEHSAIVNANRRFIYRQPTIRFSVCQKIIDGIGVSLSVPAVKLNALLRNTVNGSRFCNAYCLLLKDSAPNRYRNLFIFGFYFFLALTALALFGFTGEIGAQPCFAASVVFLLAAVLAGRPNVLKESFFVKLIMGLIK